MSFSSSGHSICLLAFYINKSMLIKYQKSFAVWLNYILSYTFKKRKIIEQIWSGYCTEKLCIWEHDPLYIFFSLCIILSEIVLLENHFNRCVHVSVEAKEFVRLTGASFCCVTCSNPNTHSYTHTPLCHACETISFSFKTLNQQALM